MPRAVVPLLRGSARRRLAAALALVALALAAAGATARPAAAASYLPPPGKVFAGVTGGLDVGRSVAGLQAETGKHPAVFQRFTYWGVNVAHALDDAVLAGARPMFHFSTTDGHRELITPGAIAAGRGDDYLLQLNRVFADSGQIVYVRLMSEMDAHWNPYSAFDANGRSRGPAHSTASFRSAWRRSVLIVRGGPVSAINDRLRALHLPPVQGAAGVLPRPAVAFLWVPQVAGAPDTAANAPRAYWPGGDYVDWVGTDFYSMYPNFSGLERFYRAFPGKPFVFGEWALWGHDDPAFVGRLFSWARSHGRTRMIMYNQGNRPDGPFRLWRYPRGRAALRRALASPQFTPFAPELAG